MEIFGNYNGNLLDRFVNTVSVGSKYLKAELLSWSLSVFPKSTNDSLRDTVAFIGSTLQPKKIERRILAISSSVSSFIKENPILFSLKTGNEVGGEAVQTFVNVPYLGAISLDVFLFSSSAILSSAFRIWKSRQNASQITSKTYRRATDKSIRQEFQNGSPSPPVKATIVNGYKDKGLYKIIRECRTVKESLRSVKDPESTRKEKTRQLALQNIRTKIKGTNSGDGYLGMSPEILDGARRSLKRVASNQRK